MVNKIYSFGVWEMHVGDQILAEGCPSSTFNIHTLAATPDGLGKAFNLS
jgi:hypothetical protein